jgi:hypothetical protein
MCSSLMETKGSTNGRKKSMCRDHSARTHRSGRTRKVRSQFEQLQPFACDEMHEGPGHVALVDAQTEAAPGRVGARIGESAAAQLAIAFAKWSAARRFVFGDERARFVGPATHWRANWA